MEARHRVGMWRASLFFLLLATAACGGDPVAGDHDANGADDAQSGAPTIAVDEMPVRIGELGPSFAACSTAGTTRRGGPLEVRAAPFDNADQAGEIKAGARFFVCTRSIDQRWMGVVYADSGLLDEVCGVSAPVSSRRAYAGACRSGWVAASAVKLVAP